MGGDRANFSTVARKSFAVKGEDWRNAGMCAQYQSGRVVVDSQSMMHVCIRPHDGSMSEI